MENLTMPKSEWGIDWQRGNKVLTIDFIGKLSAIVALFGLQTYLLYLSRFAFFVVSGKVLHAALIFSVIAMGSFAIHLLIRSQDRKISAIYENNMFQASDNRDRWIDRHLIPYIENTTGHSVGICLDKRELRFLAISDFGERVIVEVTGLEENGFSSGYPALNGYVENGMGIGVRESNLN